MIRCVALCAATLALVSAPALAQQTGSGLRLPYQKDFWGYAGFSIGQGKIDATCPPGAGCDDTDQAWRIFGGGRVNNTFGGEIGYIRFGDWNRGGGETDSKGLDLAATAGFPLGDRSSVFAKAGLIYARTQVSGTAAGLQTGTANGWGPRIGIGASIGLTQNWAIRLDADRYRIKMPSGRDNVDAITIGVQYNFR